MENPPEVRFVSMDDQMGHKCEKDCCGILSALDALQTSVLSKRICSNKLDQLSNNVFFKANAWLMCQMIITWSSKNVKVIH